MVPWVQRTGSPYLYWVARRETADAARHSLARALWRWAYPDMDDPEPPRFDSWDLLFEQRARMVAERIPAEIVVSASNDPRSYRLNSDRLLRTGFSPR